MVSMYLLCIENSKCSRVVCPSIQTFVTAIMKYLLKLCAVWKYENLLEYIRGPSLLLFYILQNVDIGFESILKYFSLQDRWFILIKCMTWPWAQSYPPTGCPKNNFKKYFHHRDFNFIISYISKWKVITSDPEPSLLHRYSFEHHVFGHPYVAPLLLQFIPSQLWTATSFSILD